MIMELKKRPGPMGAVEPVKKAETIKYDSLKDEIICLRTWN
jgi:hypothetical protein